jgi:hypoxanthine phosphoribosyltransferase
MDKREIPVLFSAAELRERIEGLAQEIATKVSPEPVIVSLLRGSFMFTADLVRELYHVGMQPAIDFMTLSSYGNNMVSSKTITVNRDLVEDVTGKDVLIVDDILESGRTLNFARNLLTDRGAASIKVVVLLEKPGKRDIPINADFVGFTIPDRFVVGYGLDYANRYRELPYIGFIDIH